MSYTEVLSTITLEAAGTIPIYGVVSVDANGKAVVTPAAGTSAAIVGVAQNPAAAGEAVTVAVSGISKAIAGAAVTAATAVAVSTADGRLADIGADKATRYVVGLALSAQANAGQYFTLLISPNRTLDTIV
jgi:hypothetical protein